MLCSSGDVTSSITDLQWSPWRKRTVHTQDGSSHPIENQQVHLKKVSFNYENWQASKDTWQLNFTKTFALAAKEDLLFCWFHEKMKHFAVSPQFSLSFFSTKTKGDFSRSLYQHYLTSLYGFDPITDQIPQDENWKFVVVSTPHSQSCLLVNGKLSLFPVSLFSPMGKILLL